MTGPAEDARVVRITDGDTIVVEIDGVEMSLRYIGIDTPEPNAEDPAVRRMAEAATAANAALVEGREVVLERDVSETDRFGRLLRDVWVEDARGELVHVGLALVASGFAQKTTHPRDVKYVDLLDAAQPLVNDNLSAVGPDEPTRFEGGIGDFAWSTVTFDGDRLTVRWDVPATGEDCRVTWRLQPSTADRITSTIRVDAGDRERDNRRYDRGYEEAAFIVRSTCPNWVLAMQTSWTASSGGGCDPSYPDLCIPPYPPDLDCGDVTARNFAIRGPDPHGFDREGDGLGCESG